jgi:hypothetical protein
MALDGQNPNHLHEVPMLWILPRTTSLRVATSARAPVRDRDGLHHPADEDHLGRHHDLRIAAGARSRILIGVRHGLRARGKVETVVALVRTRIITIALGEVITLSSSLRGLMPSMLRHQCKQHRHENVV